MLSLGAVLFLFLSAFFSGLEAAFLALDRVVINRLENSRSWLSKLVLFFNQRINRFLICLLTFNLFNNIMATLLANKLVEKLVIARFGTQILTDYNAVIYDLSFVFLFTSLLLIFSELVPKKISLRHPRLITLIGSVPMSVIYFIFFPVILSVELVLKLGSKILVLEKKDDTQEEKEFKRHELMGYAERISSSAGFEEVEGSLLKNVIQYMNTPISNLTIYREKMMGINLKKVNGQNLFNLIRDFPKPYLILFEQNKDQIVGVVTKKKLIKLLSTQSGKPSITKNELVKFSEKPIMVPESRHVLDVLQDIYYSKSEVVIVTDEHGGIEGLVTQVDIVSKVFERIPEDEKLIRKLSGSDESNTYIVKGEVKLNSFNEYFNSHFYCSQTETLNGYIVERVREIPKKGFEYFKQGFLFRVRSRTPKKVVSWEVVYKG